MHLIARSKPWIILFWMLLISCTAKKIIPPATPPVNALLHLSGLPLPEQIAVIKAHQTEFTSFSGKARIQCNFGTLPYNASINIRIQKDKQIWASITAPLGLELMRILIRPDSIYLINRFQGTYTEQSFDFVYPYTGQQISYQSLESLLIGNCIKDLLLAATDLKTGTQGALLLGMTSHWTYQVAFDQHLKTSKVRMLSNKNNDSLQIVNSDFRQVATRTVPSTVIINATTNHQNTQIMVQFTSIDFDKCLDFPFRKPINVSSGD